MPGVPFSSLPGWDFAFPRSYVYQIVIADESADVTFSDGEFVVHIDRGIPYEHGYRIEERILAWSSNRYTLGYVVVDCWWRYGSDPTHNPQAFFCNYSVTGDPPVPSLVIGNPFASPYRVEFPLEAQPFDYWLPTPLE